MSDRDLTERIRVSGMAGEPPAVDLARVRREATRRDRAGRRLVAGGIGVLVAVVVPLALWIAPDRDAPAVGPSPTHEGGPSAIPMAPGCPPRLPELTSGAGVVQGVAGHDVLLSATVPAAQPDRRLDSVRFIVVRDPGALASSALLLEHSSQAGSVEVDRPAGTLSVRLHVPADLPAGDYPIAAYATWPGPALCGVSNDGQRPIVGSSYGQIGILRVTR